MYHILFNIFYRNIAETFLSIEECKKSSLYCLKKFQKLILSKKRMLFLFFQHKNQHNNLSVYQKSFILNLLLLLWFRSRYLLISTSYLDIQIKLALNILEAVIGELEFCSKLTQSEEVIAMQYLVYLQYCSISAQTRETF